MKFETRKPISSSPNCHIKVFSSKGMSLKEDVLQAPENILSAGVSVHTSVRDNEKVKSVLLLLLLSFIRLNQFL